jgi:hypothetical protein
MMGLTPVGRNSRPKIIETLMDASYNRRRGRGIGRGLAYARAPLGPVAAGSE